MDGGKEGDNLLKTVGGGTLAKNKLFKEVISKPLCK